MELCPSLLSFFFLPSPHFPLSPFFFWHVPAVKILFPNEADPTKPSKVVEVAVNAALPTPKDGVVQVALFLLSPYFCLSFCGLILKKTLFPNEADPTKPSRAAVEAAVNAAFPAPKDGAVAIPKWREAVAKKEKEWAEEDSRLATERVKEQQKAHH
eukprot:Phypoly_transcript_19816.p1 GENE.Phypoly_transcript_19816~~Phypoly_transcript_19816.p1  ORF type:complete len:156 (+),score=38.54 Phypoly_transcript_19816:135-602(+)